VRTTVVCGSPVSTQRYDD